MFRDRLEAGILLAAKLKKYKNYPEPENLKGKMVIVIYDDIATGNTLLVTLNVLRKSKKGKIVIGIPIASKSAP